MKGFAPMGKAQSMMRTIGEVKHMLSGKDPNAVFNMLARQNPQFASFVSANKGKSPEQIARENGLDWDMVKSFLK